MNIPKIWSDYGNAILTAHRHCGLNLLDAALSVIIARLRYNLGPEFHSLFELGKRDRARWSEYIGSHEANEAFKSITGPDVRQLTKDKLAFTTHCLHHGIPTAPILFLLDQSPQNTQTEFENNIALNDWLLALETAPDRIFIKQIDGGHGLGAFVASRDKELWRYEGRTGSATDLHSYCVENIIGRRGWIVQPEIRPHPAMARQLSPHALSTVRIVTGVDHGGARLLYALIKIAVGANQTDNWSLGMAGNLVAPINVETGALGVGYASRLKTWPAIYSTSHHPDTGLAIEGFVLPHWEETKALALLAQQETKGLGTAGWDIAITESGPLVLETNWGYGVEIIEVALQRGIRRDLEFLLRTSCPVKHH